MGDVYLSEGGVKEIAGMVVPVWFSKKAETALAEKLLALTLDNYGQYVRPENVCLVVDGDERSLRIARKVQKAMAKKGGGPCEVLYLAQNRGKNYAVKEGILRLMRNRGIEYFVVRDCDADHFICDLPNLVRSAHHVSVSEKTDRVLVIGRRIDRHRPLGFLRGEMEEICNRVMLDSFNYWLARRGRVFNSQYYSPYGDVPDFKSGYKVYSRGLARRIFTKNPRLLCLEEKDYWRHGAEPIVMVEAVVAGATVGETNRTTFDVQPTTTFTESSAMDMHIKTMAWMFCRLGIPLACTEQMLDNHIPRVLLVTDAAGKEQLDALKRDTLAFYARHLGQTYSHTTPISRPRFF